MITRLLILCNLVAYAWEVKVAGWGALSVWGGDLTNVLAAAALNPVSVLTRRPVVAYSHQRISPRRSDASRRQYVVAVDFGALH